jgi:hydrogenase large subunit
MVCVWAVLSPIFRVATFIYEGRISVKITASFDPVTRIEGHLKVDVEFDTVAGVQQVVDVRASGLLFRDFENLLIGRDPRDAQHITQRICGVCPVAHGMAAVKALDLAASVTIPNNARLMRNLVSAANFIESHILHFYLLSLPDFIAGPSMPPWQVDWNRDRRFSPSASQGLMDNYLKALAMRRRAHEMGALFGGRMPHPPAYIPGGFTAIPRPERIEGYRQHLEELTGFVQNRYIPDAERLAAQYPDYFSLGRGHGHLLSFGAFDQAPSGNDRLFTDGHIVNAAAQARPIDSTAITEHVTYSWFKRSSDGLNPGAGQTKPVDPITNDEAYSWLKAPRYQNEPYEVGPLSRMWINGEYQRGISVMDRHLARAQEALKVARAAQQWLDGLVPDAPVYTEPRLPDAASSIGLTEAPRGALGHRFQIVDGRLSHYQIITPTTWNVSPRDNRGVHGPLEQALLGLPVDNADEPVEVMRVIHSLDPCLDCAAHVIRPKHKAKIYRLGAC